MAGSFASADRFANPKKMEAAKKSFPSENNADESDQDSEDDTIGLLDQIIPSYLSSSPIKIAFLSGMPRFTGGHWHITTPPPRLS